MRPAASVFPEAFCSVAGKKLLKFVRESHLEMKSFRVIAPKALRHFSLGHPPQEMKFATQTSAESALQKMIV
jgi:hypothetical protein